jgi:drug/metabolite transporter (DMT)-like permease
VLTGADAAALLSVAVWGANFPILRQVMLAIDPLPAMLLRGGLSTLSSTTTGSTGAARRTRGSGLIYANMESFFAVVAAAVLLGERVTWTAVAGGAAVVAGVLLTRRGGGEA